MTETIDHGRSLEQVLSLEQECVRLRNRIAAQEEIAACREDPAAPSPRHLARLVCELEGHDRDDFMAACLTLSKTFPKEKMWAFDEQLVDAVAYWQARCANMEKERDEMEASRRYWKQRCLDLGETDT